MRLSGMSDYDMQKMNPRSEKYTNDERSKHRPRENPFFAEISEFELMHVKITILDLSGILIEDKYGFISHSVKEESGTNIRKTRRILSSTGSNGDYTGSPITTMEDDFFDFPMYAVVTHKRNVTSNATSIASHLPSMQIGRAVSSQGCVGRHHAVWPAQKAMPLLHENESTFLDQSSFIMERVMMRIPFEHQRTGCTNILNNFLPETIDLNIQLKHRSEMLSIGIASFVVTGEEDVSVRMNIPVKTIEEREKKVIVLSRKTGKIQEQDSEKEVKNEKRRQGIFKKGKNKPLKRKTLISLDDNAMLRIAIQVISHTSLQELEEARRLHVQKERRRIERRERKVSPSLVSPENFKYLIERYERVNKSGKLNERNYWAKDGFNELGISRFLCSSVECLAISEDEHSNCDRKSARCAERDFFRDSKELDGYLKYYSSDESSGISSVSSSESESESESEEEGLHLHRNIIVRRHS